MNFPQNRPVARDYQAVWPPRKAAGNPLWTNLQQVHAAKTAPGNRSLNLLAYVHLHNIHRSTGAGRVARQLIEHLAKRGDSTLRILAARSDHDAIVPQVGQPWATFKYHLFDDDVSIRQAKWLALNRPTAEDFWPEADVVHCTGESYVPTKRSRLVVTVHDAAYFDQGAHEENFANIKQLVKWRTLYATLARRVDIFHTVSHFSADRLAATFPEIRSRLRVINNAVSSDFFEPVDDNGKLFIEDLGLSSRPFVLIPGGLHYRKNAALILKAWPLLKQRIPGLTLVIAGHCSSNYESQARAIDPSIIFPGFVTDPCLRALYHAALSVWFPSRYEGFGLPVLEAMACGAGVVASRCSAIPEVAGNAALLADVDSVGDHVDALESIIQGGRLRSELQKRGKERASHYQWEGVAARMREVYSDLV